MSLILPANSLTGGYEIANSLRFNKASSDYLNRTQSAGNRKTFTFSAWIKLSELSNIRYLYSSFNAYTDAGYTVLYLTSSNTIKFMGYSTTYLETNQLFRDVSAWYHVIIAVDTTQATSSDRVKMYINGSQVTSFLTANYPTQNNDLGFNQASVVSRLGTDSYGDAPDNYFSGYMSEVNFIDGQALDPTSFGEFDEDTGTWKPIKYTGTYGTNGFYLDFENSGSLGADQSGNGNNFTVNNLTSIDQTTDTPTNNFTLLNTLNYSTSTRTYGEGNTAITSSSSDEWHTALNNIGVRSGKWYAELKINNVGSFSAIGVIYQPIPSPVNPSASLNFTFLVGEDTGSAGWRNNGAMPQGGTLSTYTTGDILMIAMDMDNLKLYFGKNGTWENSGVPTSGATGTGSILNLTANEDYFFVISPRGGSTYCNFGNPPYSANGYTDGAGYGNFSYAVPSGYYSLCTKNLAEFG